MHAKCMEMKLYMLNTSQLTDNKLFFHCDVSSRPVYDCLNYN